MGKRIQDSEKRRLVEEWDESDQSAGAFAESRGVHPATLGAWGREVRGLIRRRPPKRPIPREVKLVGTSSPYPVLTLVFADDVFGGCWTT